MTEQVDNVARINALEDNMLEVKQAIRSIADSLEKLTALEVRHAETRSGLERAFSSIGDHEKRMRKMEENMPILKMTSGWVQKIGWLVVSLVVGAVLFLVVKK